jgi:hypothetical protein
MIHLRRRATTAGLAALLLACLGCGRARPSADRPYALPVDVFADTGRGEPMRVVTPPAPAARTSVWMGRVSPSRPSMLALPQAELGAETLTVDDDLKPPIPRTRAALVVPAHARGFVELDVRVDEEGRVSDALWAAGSQEPALVRAATDCALEMRFYPALRVGRPVAVWCRQRFDFAEAGPGEAR